MMTATIRQSVLGAALGIFALAPMASAATYTFQDGLNGYDGTQDASLYAGDPTGINTGASPTLYNNGVHRSILSFDLSSLAGKTVTSDATLTLTMADNHPDINFSLYAISDANAGWWQGDNLAYGQAGAGEVTYEDLSYPDTPWVGGDGLQGTGGYDPTAVAHGVGGAVDTTVVMSLPQWLIQHWIDGPNAGLLILSDTLGEVIQFRSSDDTIGQPLLQVSAVPEPGTLSALGLMAGAMLLGRRRK